LRHEHTLNPAMGLRAIRWSLSDPAMFEVQLRAILRAASHGPVRLLVPMLTHLSEIRATFDALRRVRAQLMRESIPHGSVEIGAMVEVPAAALTMPIFLRYFDFVSIGTNDLIQYTLAIDRAEEAVAHLYDPWHPAVLRLIADTISQAHAAGKGISVCGEMAGDIEFTELLLGLGLRSFSMHPAQIPAIKQRILRSDSKRLRAYAAAVMSSDEPRSVGKDVSVAGAKVDAGEQVQKTPREAA